MGLYVDIETEWNLKSFMEWLFLWKTGRYRNRVEFKADTTYEDVMRMLGRYRNRVEFKDGLI